MQAAGAATTNFNAATAQQTVTIGKATATINVTGFSGPYDGTNAGTPFIFDTSNQVLYFDANGGSAGYTVIAKTTDAQVTHNDIELLSTSQEV